MKLCRIIVFLIISALLISAGLYQYSEEGITTTVRDVFALLSDRHRLTMHVHDTHLLKIRNNAKVRWYSGNDRIVSVNRYGRAYAHRVGQATIYATGSLHTYKCSVTVDKSYIHAIDCIGDSITYGTGVRPHQLTDSYPAILDQRFSYDVLVKNYGAPSHTLQKEGDYPYVKTGYLQKVEKDQPDIILFMLGTNDCKSYNWNEKRFIREYTLMIDQLKKLASHPDIYVMIPPSLSLNHRGAPTRIVSANIEKLPKIIRKIASSTHVHVINLHSILNLKTDYDDKVHPNRKGNAKIVDHIEQVLDREYNL